MEILWNSLHLGVLTWNVYVDSVCTELASGALAKYCPIKYRQRRIMALFTHIFPTAWKLWSSALTINFESVHASQKAIQIFAKIISESLVDWFLKSVKFTLLYHYIFKTVIFYTVCLPFQGPVTFTDMRLEQRQLPNWKKNIFSLWAVAFTGGCLFNQQIAKFLQKYTNTQGVKSLS